MSGLKAWMRGDTQPRGMISYAEFSAASRLGAGLGDGHLRLIFHCQQLTDNQAVRERALW